MVPLVTVTFPVTVRLPVVLAIVPPETISAPLRVVLVGKVIVPEFNCVTPVMLNVVNVEKFAVAPSTVNAFVVPVKPVNPDSVLPVFNASVPVVIVSVPVPDNVLLVVKPVGIVGLFPSGSGQFALIVFSPVCPAKLTSANA
jgi:hypothetical protein